MDQTAELNDRLARSGPVVDFAGESFTCDWRVVVPLGVEARSLGHIRPTDGLGLTPPAGSKASWRRNIHHLLVLGRAIDVHTRGPGATYNPDTEAQHGFALGPGAVVEDCTVHDVLGDGISFGESSGCRARRVAVDGAGRQGMSWVNGHDGRIEDCSFTRIAHSPIDIEPWATNGQVVRGFTAVRTIVGTYGNRVFASGGSGEVHDVLVDGLTVPAGWLAVEVEGGPRSGFTFRACVGVKAKNLSAFTLRGITGVVVDACSQPFAGKVRPPAVRAIGCTGVKVLQSCSWPGASVALATT